MPPARRRVANKAKNKAQLSLGDLVLAKVKGHPFWPAKISKPEDWDKVPDPKKHFVQFFGTEEIAFVAPADIQAFTSEVKSKISSRCHGKTKYFSQAVKEICEEFDELEKKNSNGLRDDTDRSDVGCDAPSGDGVEDNGVNVDLKNDEAGGVGGETVKEKGAGDFGSKLERCSQVRGGNDFSGDVEPSSCGAKESSSPVFSSENKNKVSSASHPKVSKTSNSDITSPLKKEVSGYKHEDSDIHTKKHGEGQKSLVNGHKLTKMVSESKRRGEGPVEVLKGSSVTSLKKGVSVGSVDHQQFGERMRDGAKGRTSSGSNKRKLSPDSVKPASKIRDEKKNTDLLKAKKHVKVQDEAKDCQDDTEEQARERLFGRTKKAQVGSGKPSLGSNDTLHPSKKLKHVDGENTHHSSFPKSIKSLSPPSDAHLKTVKKLDSKMSTSRVKAENNMLSKSQIVNASGDEAVLPLAKRRRRAMEAMSDPDTLVSDDKMEKDSAQKNNASSDVRVSATQTQRKRRAVCLYDEEEEEEKPKTPVHGGSSRYVKAPSKFSDTVTAVRNSKRTTEFHESHVKEPSSRLKNGSVSPTKPHVDEIERQSQTDEKRPEKAVHSYQSPAKSEHNQQLPKEAKPTLASPKKSPMLAAATKPAVEHPKATKAKPTGTTSKSLAVSGKTPNSVSSHLVSSQSPSTIQRNRPATSGEKSKPTARPISRISDSTVLLDNTTEYNSLPAERTEVGKEESALLIDSRTLESSSSMRDLIAVAQCIKKQTAQSNNFFPGLSSSAFLPSAEGTSPGPPVVQGLFPITSTALQADIPGSNQPTNLASPSSHGHPSASQDQLEIEDTSERRVSSGHRAAGGSLSGGTEAAVARDAFEGMIETLSRTKESIHRATRLAIECANKYGIANEVVELLIRKLESEPSFTRKIDLFFLVDSITQLSNNQKDGAGVSYVPTVQAALPRLLGAAAPPGSGARENRRQCHKVLRLWIERKIFPQQVIRRYMDDIGVPSNDTSGFSLRRPSRAERAIDDPIREMEGMFVDEYGSNATFQLPGFLSSRAFEDEEEEEEELPSCPYKEARHPSPVQLTHASGEVETCAVTPNDRRHCILEDVDGELEMEDVSGHPKDERPMFVSGSFEVDPPHQASRAMDPSLNVCMDFPPLEGSPPLPLDSPPPLPPLPPSSPPPPPPPPLSSPPPPPPPPSQPPPHLPPSNPPPLLIAQSSVPTQPPFLAQQMPPPQSSQLPYQPSVPQGNQIVQLTGSAPHGGAIGPREPSGFISANQQFQQGNAPFAPRPLHPAPPQNPSSHFSYAKPSLQQHPQHPYRGPYPLPPVPDNQRRFVADEPRGAWINGVRPPHPGPPFGHEGYYRPPLERPPTNNMSFQRPPPNNAPSGAPISGHGAAQILPCRPDISTANCWRPA